MATIPFWKATACGNDFLLIDSQQAPPDLATFTRQICDRHNGVGADGVEWYSTAAKADLRIRLINADGSDAEISGNGTRCVAAWYCSQRDRDQITIETDAGLKVCELISSDGHTFQFRSSMGQPRVDPELQVTISVGVLRGTPVSMGNPHYVMFVSRFEPGWQALAAKIATHPQFPRGTNVELVHVKSESEIEVRFLERGVGETMSSGTGSCAAAIASIHNGSVKSPVRVVAPGGMQVVEWRDQVFLTGPATLLCRGEFFL